MSARPFFVPVGAQLARRRARELYGVEISTPELFAMVGRIEGRKPRNARAIAESRDGSVSLWVRYGNPKVKRSSVLSRWLLVRWVPSERRLEILEDDGSRRFTNAQHNPSEDE